MVLITGSIMDNSVIQFITVTLIFVFVLGITIFATHFIGTRQKKQITQGNIKIIDSLRLSNNKVLEIVQVGDKNFLIAVCKDTVTTIGEINIDTLDLQSEKDGTSFGSVFSRFKVVHDKDEKDDMSPESMTEEEEVTENEEQNS